MDQRAPHRCQHGHLNGLGPQCYSRYLQAVEPAPPLKLESVEIEAVEAPVARAPKVRKVAAVSNAKSDAKPVSNGAARIARWRANQDPEVRKRQNREAVQRSRAKAKAGKVAAA